MSWTFGVHCSGCGQASWSVRDGSWTCNTPGCHSRTMKVSEIKKMQEEEDNAR